MPSTAIEHMQLALKVLSAQYKIRGKISASDVKSLRDYLGDAATGLADDRVACAVIEQEVRRLKAHREAGAIVIHPARHRTRRHSRKGAADRRPPHA